MDLSLRRYTKHDYLTLCEWFAKHKMKAPLYFLLPPVGMIVDGIAAGFLIETNCHVAILDFFVTNPDVDSEARNKAIEEIVSSLQFYAGANDFKYLKCDSSIDSIKQRALARGFKKIDDVSVFYKEL